jgi:hypothetical protein
MRTRKAGVLWGVILLAAAMLQLAVGETYAQCPSGTSPVYRFFNKAVGAHFYTISESEKNDIATNYPLYVYEGPAYCAVPLDRGPVLTGWAGLWSGSVMQFFVKSDSSALTSAGSSIAIPNRSDKASLKLGPIRETGPGCSVNITLYLTSTIPISNAGFSYRSSDTNISGQFTNGLVGGNYSDQTYISNCGVYVSASGSWQATPISTSAAELANFDLTPGKSPMFEMIYDPASNMIKKIQYVDENR